MLMKPHTLHLATSKLWSVLHQSLAQYHKQDLNLTSHQCIHSILLVKECSYLLFNLILFILQDHYLLIFKQYLQLKIVVVWLLIFLTYGTCFLLEKILNFRWTFQTNVVINHPSKINSTAIAAGNVKSKIARARLVDNQPRLIWKFYSKAIKAWYSIVLAIVLSCEEISSGTLLKGFEKR